MNDKEVIPKELNSELVYYMFSEIKAELKEIKKEYVTRTESLALKNEIGELRKDVERLKDSKTLRNTVLWVGLVSSAIINIVALYNIFTRGR